MAVRQGIDTAVSNGQQRVTVENSGIYLGDLCWVGCGLGRRLGLVVRIAHLDVTVLMENWYNTERPTVVTFVRGLPSARELIFRRST